MRPASILRATRSPFISAKALASSSRIPIDGTWFMPNVQRSARAEYLAKHIPRARFFDLDAISDTSSPYPHMFPSTSTFESSMSSLGIRKSDDLCIYDTIGLFSAARVYYTFKLFGHAGDVKILEGGFPAYLEAALPTVSGEDVIDHVEYGKAALQHNLVVQFDEIVQIGKKNPEVGNVQVLDARPEGRFSGAAPEPRPGLSSGHMPHATSLPFSAVQKDGEILEVEALRKVLQDRGINLQQPIVTSCGTGVTACVLSVALETLGVESRVYDESWTGYAMRAADKPDLIVKDV